MTLGGIFFDEVALMPQSFVEQGLARLSVEGAKFWFNCNPKGPTHWFKKEYVDKVEEKNILYLHFTMDDNLTLSERVKDRFKRMFIGVFYKRNILGLWTTAEGAIYRLFADNTQDFLINEVKDNLLLVTIGIDYGAGASKIKFVATGITYKFEKVIVLDEYDLKEVYDPEQIYDHFLKFYQRVYETYDKCQYVFADYGALGNVITLGLIKRCQKEGLPVSVQDCTKGFINDRIFLSSTLMAQHRLLILKQNKVITQAFCDAVWDDKHPDTRLDDGTTDIDSLDAFEYSINNFYEQLIRRS